MKKLFCLLLLLSFSAKSQTKISETKKYKQIGLVWGILKYHHPDISQGIYNWDQELINLINATETINEQENLNDILLDFIKKFDKPTTAFKTHPIKIDSEKIFKKNYDYDWINNIAFNAELKSALNKLKSNKNIGDYYAKLPKLSKIIAFNNEKELQDFNPLLKSHRLLTLNRFWNIIQYWDVNKYLTDTKWINVLEELTHSFINAKTVEDYEIAKLNMFSKLNDSHSYQAPPMLIYKSLLNYVPSFQVKIINDSLLVTAIYNKKLAQKDEIKLGDIIVRINDLTITDYINEKFSPLISTSNNAFLKERLDRFGFILKNNKDSLRIHILTKQNKIVEKTITLYNTYEIENLEYLVKKDNSKWKKITPKITYINLSLISSKELSQVFKENNDDDGIILDLRNYPKQLSLKDFSKILYPEEKTFLRALIPLKENPSIGELNGVASLKLIHDPFKVGKKNSKYFKGKIILLVNRTTASMSEYYGMAIQQAPNCTTIGEQTAGAVMNITSAILPDNQEFYFTSMGAFYPNGEEVQRKGLHIDYPIKESSKNYNPNLYIEKAVEIIENKVN